MEVIKAQTQQELFAVINIRKEVFILEQNVPIEDEFDKFDESATHYLITLNNNFVGTARLIASNNQYTIGRVAILKRYRRQGYASNLLLEILKQIPDDVTVKLGAQKQALGFYEQLGFKVSGDLYYDAGIEHYPMELINNVETKL